MEYRVLTVLCIMHPKSCAPDLLSVKLPDRCSRNGRLDNALESDWENSVTSKWMWLLQDYLHAPDTLNALV